MRRALMSLISAGLMVILGLPAAGYSADWSVIDHRVQKDESGIWNPTVYRGLVGALSIAALGGALWEGSESRFGKTLWQTIDSELLAAGSTTAMKYLFTRKRPSETSDPNEWFAHGSNDSFPSTEAAFSASLVTPFVLEYAGEHPAAYGLLALPLYVGIGRVKNQAHWQSDVLVGWAIGGFSGWYTHSRESPILVQVFPHGVFVGLKTRF
jgi:hypothetical protein